MEQLIFPTFQKCVERSSGELASNINFCRMFIFVGKMSKNINNGQTLLFKIEYINPEW